MITDKAFLKNHAGLIIETMIFPPLGIYRWYAFAKRVYWDGYCDGREDYAKKLFEAKMNSKDYRD